MIFRTPSYSDTLYADIQPSYKDSLSHHGIKGQKWGVRRFQNPDGSYTAAGKARRGSGSIKGRLKDRKEQRLRDKMDPQKNPFTKKEFMNGLKYAEKHTAAFEGMSKQERAWVKKLAKESKNFEDFEDKYMGKYKYDDFMGDMIYDAMEQARYDKYWKPYKEKELKKKATWDEKVNYNTLKRAKNVTDRKAQKYNRKAEGLKTANAPKTLVDAYKNKAVKQEKRRDEYKKRMEEYRDDWRNRTRKPSFNKSKAYKKGYIPKIYYNYGLNATNQAMGEHQRMVNDYMNTVNTVNMMNNMMW